MVVNANKADDEVLVSKKNMNIQYLYETFLEISVGSL